MRLLDPKYHNTDKTIDEILNGMKGGEPWTPSEYSTEPDYDQVEPQVFQYLDEVFQYDE